MKLFKDILTGIDNKTYDNVRVYMLLGVLTYLACTVYHLYDDNVFDFVAFGSGFGVIMAGGGAGIGLKMKTEPCERKEDD